MRWRLILMAVGSVAFASAAPLACFSLKQPPCAFTCVEPPHRCPASYTCGSDGLCHLEGATGICPFSPPDDGGRDAYAASTLDAPDGPDAPNASE
jgi:hypothetical protein